MRHPRGAPILLLLLLPPLLLAPRAGDAAVITGVSSPAPVAAGAREAGEGTARAARPARAAGRGSPRWDPPGPPRGALRRVPDSTDPGRAPQEK